jgi:hypothetical protein
MATLRTQANYLELLLRSIVLFPIPKRYWKRIMLAQGLGHLDHMLDPACKILKRHLNLS